MASPIANQEPGGVTGAERAPASFLPFAGVDRQTAWLRAILLSACFLGMLTSVGLWLDSRAFPLLPIAAGFPVLASPWDKYFFALMLLALVLAVWFYQPAVLFFLLAGLFSFCEDQNRGQPWFYMYWVMLLLTWLPGRTGIAACRLAMSAAYVWSGIQKCNARFFEVVPGWFVSPAAHWHLPPGALILLKWAVAAAPFVEIFIGLALWAPRTRRVAIGAAVLVHGAALLFLGPLGHNYDLVVWPWNIAMIALVFVLFPAAPAAGINETLAELRASRPAFAVVALYTLLPLLSYIGWWDSYFSFCLFATSEAKADIFVTQAFSDRLPDRLRAHVHPVRVAYNPQIQGPYVFDFQTWSQHELGVPPIFEPRNYQSIFRYLRAYSKEPADLRMIISPRFGPMTFYQGEKSMAIVTGSRM